MARKTSTWFALVAAAVLAASGRSAADVAVGDHITDQNVDKVKDLISPGLEWCIQHGFPITIGETKRIEWPQGLQGGDREVRGPGEARAPTG